MFGNRGLGMSEFRLEGLVFRHVGRGSSGFGYTGQGSEIGAYGLGLEVEGLTVRPEPRP